MTTITATEIVDAINALTENGKAFMRQVGQHGFDFFDGGIVEGEGNWGKNLAQQLAVAATPRSASGIMNRTAKLGLWTVGTDDDGEYWWKLTALGAEVAQTLALGTDRVEHASVEDINAAIEQGSLQDTLDEVADAVEKVQAEAAAADGAELDSYVATKTTLSRKDCITELRARGYTGPVSYLVPKLNTILATVIAGPRQA
jgi:hypothetical protein